MGNFERYLSVWVALAIAAGIGLGQVAPGVFGVLSSMEYANVNFPVALLIWAMVWPMMIGVDFATLKDVGDKPKGLIITLVVNWLIKPFTMAALGVLFFRYVFADLIHCGSYPARRGAVHGHGLRLVAADARGPELYAGPGQRE